MLLGDGVTQLLWQEILTGDESHGEQVQEHLATRECNNRITLTSCYDASLQTSVCWVLINMTNYYKYDINKFDNLQRGNTN